MTEAAKIPVIFLKFIGNSMRSVAEKFTVFFLKFKENMCRLRDTKTTPNTENTSTKNYFDIGVNNKFICDERNMFPVSLQNFYLYLNP